MKSYRLPPGLRERVSTGLLPWFDLNARDLPWRRNRSPYAVWISEAMLQQTRVDTVIPYFEAWMARFPSVEGLAAADQQAVLKVWEGLGYYARARNLHRAARRIVERHGGAFPDDPVEAAALPGIGPYTLAAVMSLAFHRPFAVLDGNVERVLTRLCAIGDDIRSPAVKAALRAAAGRMLADHPPGRFNEAVMELGATVCLPRNPRCGLCPLSPVCRARKRGETDRYPHKSSKARVPTVEVGAGVVWRDETTFLVARRKEEGMLGGLWEFPGGKREPGESFPDCVRRELREELDIEVAVGELLLVVRHSYSHFNLRMPVHHCRWTGGEPKTLDCADFRWTTLADCRGLPFSRADLKVIEALEGTVGGLRPGGVELHGGDRRGR